MDLSSDLVLASAAIVLVGFLLAHRFLSANISLGIAVAKAAIFFVYFAFFFDGSWHFLDDFIYLRNGELMLLGGYTPWTAITTQAGIDEITVVVGGEHLLYDWWNMLGQFLFGFNYFAPVALNVMLTFVCGIVGIKIARECGLSQSYSRWLLVFVLFHWEILAWTSFINQKDMMVMTLSTGVFYFVIRMVDRPGLLNLAGIIVPSLLLMVLRFYIPVVILLTATLWMIIQTKRGKTSVLLASGALAGIAAFGAIFQETFDFVVLRDLFSSNDLFEFLFGIAHMAFSPQPWSLSPEYTFLMIPSALHLLMFVPMVVGGFWLCRAHPKALLLVLYLIVGVLFYAGVEELRGPRHRIQFTFVIAWLQFHFLWTALSMARDSVRHVPSAGRAVRAA